jgi:16S rRNA (cytosine967-C5)-methyltransferase
MYDLPARAERAGAVITQLETAKISYAGVFDVVLCDAPCSGSGAWRRAAEGKWTLTAKRLIELNAMQDRILVEAMQFVAPGGTLAYATCSVLQSENEDRVTTFLNAHSDWTERFVKRFDVDVDGDGFFTAHLTRAS